MKLTVNDLYAMTPADGSQSPLAEAYGNGLPFKVSMTIKRLMDDLANEMKLVEPERIRLVKQYGTPKKDENGKVVENMYDLPQKGKKAVEWIEQIAEFGNVIVEVRYTPIDLDQLATDMENKIIKGSFVSIVDQLNKVYEKQKEEAEKPKEKSEEVTH